MADLFGNPDRLETRNAKAERVSLFDAAAESIAYENGRNVAQVRTELVHGLGRDSFGQIKAYMTCETCGACFCAKPRVPAICNLCRQKARS